MLDILIHVWSKQNKTAIALLGLAPLVISCAATDVTDPPSDNTTSSALEAPANSNLGLQVSEIPLQFQGEWNLSSEDCGVPGSDGRLQIGLNRIDFYETFGNVQEAIVQGDLKMTVTAEYASEGEIFTRTDSFELSSDRSVLTHSDTNVIRYRCSN